MSNQLLTRDEWRRYLEEEVAKFYASIDESRKRIEKDWETQWSELFPQAADTQTSQKLGSDT
jgi:hypothetical protein